MDFLLVSVGLRSSLKALPLPNMNRNLKLAVLLIISLKKESANGPTKTMELGNILVKLYRSHSLVLAIMCDAVPFFVTKLSQGLGFLQSKESPEVQICFFFVYKYVLMFQSLNNLHSY